MRTITLSVSSLLALGIYFMLPAQATELSTELNTESFTKKPVRVTTLNVNNVGIYRATLRWEQPNRSEYYKVQLQDQNGTVLNRWTHHRKRERQIARDTNLLRPSTQYQYRVRACNDIGCSKWSSTVRFATASVSANVSEEILALEAETYELINDYRVSQGLAELDYNEEIAAIAREHSQNMAEGSVEFGHDGFTDRYNEMFDLFDGAGGGAENVAWMTERANMAQVAKDGWVASEGHRINIEGDYTRTGMGIAEQDGRYYFTQLFLYVSE